MQTYEQAVVLFEKKLNSGGGLDMAQVLENYAFLLIQRDKKEEAQKIAERARQIRLRQSAPVSKDL